MTAGTLEDKLRDFDSPVDMLRNAATGPYLFPVAPEFSNWRDEQRAWMESAVLVDQSFHMTDGAELTIVWGEPDGGSAKPVVERHVQVEIPAVLSTASPVIHRPVAHPSSRFAA